MTSLLGVNAYAPDQATTTDHATRPSVRNDSAVIVGKLAVSVYEVWRLGVRTGAKLEHGNLGF